MFAEDHSQPLRALLGPTNTGKTWRAIRRMLGHRTGMIGLPLRLLAREVYDRVSAEVGEEQVALVTGEEKRVPARPRYWVCTTESMPLDRPVDFLAIDEVQLIGHRERGHTFTDRVLRARGFRETWLLGSDTAEPLLRSMVPTVEVERLDRLSRLRWAGVRPLERLPPRSALIAFSADEVYRLADALRRRHGGAAVVMGALSPRTRNAQVALYQSGEVPWLVATDAIGMGLNMDIEHVAFASLSKWDGRETRALTVPELAQIAGRAGRFRRDGTFGTLDAAGELPPDWILALESHRFPPMKAAYWRSPELDLSSPQALLESLRRPPPARIYRAAPRTTDVDALTELAGHPSVRAAATTPERVALLWEICRLPDFQQTLTADHTRLLLELWRQLTGPRERLDPDWLQAEIAPLDQSDGDLETLLVRIAQIRTWTSISFHAAWIGDRAWQERTRDIEDRLSDALHHRLTERFVDRRTMALVGGGRAPTPRIGQEGAVDAAGHALGSLRGLTFTASHPADKAGWRVLREGLREELDRRVEAMVEAPFEAILLDDEGGLRWEGGRLGRWVTGDELTLPQVRMDELPLLGPGARQRVHRRLVAWSRDAAARLLAPLRGPELGELGPAGRGLVFLLEQGLGSVWRAEAEDRLEVLTPADRRGLAAMGVRLGTAVVYAAPLLEPEATRIRALLWACWRGRAPVLSGGAASFAFAGDPTALLPMGYAAAGPRALRQDRLEEALARLRAAANAGPFAPPPAVARVLELEPEALPAVVEALGWPRRPDGLHIRPPSGRPRVQKGRRSA